MSLEDAHTKDTSTGVLPVGEQKQPIDELPPGGLPMIDEKRPHHGETPKARKPPVLLGPPNRRGYYRDVSGVVQSVHHSIFIQI